MKIMNRVNIALVKQKPCHTTHSALDTFSKEMDMCDLVDTVCLGFHKASTEVPHQVFLRETKSQFHKEEGHLNLK